MIKYQEERLEDCLDEMKPLFESHWEEIAMHKDKVKLDPDYDSYLNMDKIGVLHVVTARDEGKIIGYFISFLTPHLHYKSSSFAMNDILYIDEEYRGRFAGLKMFKFAEKKLKERGVQILMLHIKTKHDFGNMLERIGYEHVEQNYSKYIGE